VDVDAFLAMSLGGFAEPEELFVLNPNKPAVTGRDYIQRPLMMTTGSQDILATTTGEDFAVASNAAFYDPVTKAAGINDAPAYGLVIDQANHITPAVIFDKPGNPVLAWTDPNTPANTLGWSYFTPFIDKEQLSAQQSADLKEGGALKDIVSDWVEHLIGSALSITVLRDKADLQVDDGLLPYTLDFWDAFLGRNYDAAAASIFLDQPPLVHMDHINNPNNQIFDIQQPAGSGHHFGFASSFPGAWIIKDASGNPLTYLTDQGDLLLLKGTFTTGQLTLTQTVNREFVVKDNSGIVLMLVNGATGSVKIRGSLTQNFNGLTSLSTTSELVVRASTDTGADAQAVLTSGGALKLRGSKYQGWLDILGQ
jgi:hypothetical protein